MSNLALIQPQPVDFDTTQLTDWLDGLPTIVTPGSGGAIPGDGNAGNGTMAVASVAADTAYGVHIVTVTGVAGGFTHVSVTDPTGAITAQGVVGLPLYAAGLTLQLAQGGAPFAVGDSFAAAVVPVPVDITGLKFDLDARESVSAATIALQATSAGETPTIANGGAAGTVAMAVPRATMAGVFPKPDGYPYGITATDPITGLKVPAFYGRIHHTAVPAQIGQA